MSTGLCFANPSGPEVIHGEVNFGNPESHLLQINTGTDLSIINWQDFSIDAGEITRFIQPSDLSAVLNRVITDKETNISGLLEANGQLLLINQNGIIIHADGIINVDNFIGSTYSLTDECFLSDTEKVFEELTENTIINFGKIHALSGSFTLLARKVDNLGSIKAPNGTVSLASSTQIILRPDDNQKIMIRPKVDPADRELNNAGTIEAIQVEMKPSCNPYSMAINRSGEIDALGIIHKDGRVILVADDGMLSVTGNITAKNTGDTGGEVQLLGEKVGLFDKAIIDVSGKNGGGTLLMGGDYQGSNPDIPNSEFTYVGPDVEVNASALENGTGGKVVFWADDTTQYYRVTDARGGEISGGGGYVEVSGKKGFDYQGRTDRSAPYGMPGILLLDPQSDVTVGPGTAGGMFVVRVWTPTVDPSTISIANMLTELTGGDVVVQTTFGGGGATGTITLLSALMIPAATPNKLTLQSNGTGGVIIDNVLGSAGDVEIIAATGPVEIIAPTTNAAQITTLSGKAHGFNRGMRASISCPFLFIPLAYFPIGCRFSCFRNCLYQTAKTKKLITQ